MITDKPSVRIKDSMMIIKFYYSLLYRKPLLSTLVIVLGFMARAVSVLVFVMTLKVFLSILDPTTVVKLLETYISKYYDSSLSVSGLLNLLVIGLAGLVIIQLALNKLYLFLFLQLRATLQKMILAKPLNEHFLTNVHVCIDKLPQGYEAVVKVSEILLFYFFLLLGIFYLSKMAGLLLLVIIPLIVLIMVVKGRKEVHVQMDIRDKRKSLVEVDSDYEGYISLNDENYLYGRNSVIYADFFGGFALVFLILVFLIMNPAGGDSFSGLTALFLVFSIRFAVLYAGELSRFLGKVIQQRVIVDKIATKSF
jgi:hypothetical protein